MPHSSSLWSYYKSGYKNYKWSHFFEIGSLLIYIMAIERVIEYTLELQNKWSHQLPTITEEASHKIQKIQKKICGFKMDAIWYGKCRCVIFSSWCAKRFLCERAIFLKPSQFGKDVEDHITHIILYMFTKLQNYILCWMGKLYSSRHARYHPFVHQIQSYFHTT